MNGTPHAHSIDILDQRGFWYVSYGDQTRTVSKPMFRDPQVVLTQAVKKIISKHDEESQRQVHDSL